MNKTEKLEPLFSYYGEIVAFKFRWMNYISLSDAERMRRYIQSKAKVGEDEEITVWLCGAGLPDFVDVDKSIETGKYNFYNSEDIQWTPTPIEEYNP